MLVLFDIDGTLVSVRGAGRRALNRAVEALTGVADALEGVRLHGSTDPVILEQAFAQKVGRPLEDGEEAQIYSRYLGHLAEEVEAGEHGYEVLPGVRDVVEALAATGRHVLGLATGNIEAAAKIKLDPGGLSDFFGFGGFGSDAGVRAELVRAGIEKGQAVAQAQLGRRVDLEEVVVIGDTEKDVAAAHAAGVRAVGVLAGSGHPDLLEASGPDLLVDSCADPALWRFLGLS